jgi:hypothetical protein
VLGTPRKLSIEAEEREEAYTMRVPELKHSEINNTINLITNLVCQLEVV